MAEDQSNASKRLPAERYYTEHVRISLNKGADNELLRRFKVVG